MTKHTKVNTMNAKDTSAHNTILKRDPLYFDFVKGRADGVSPIGYKYSKIYGVVNSERYKAFERANANTRSRMFLGGKIGMPEIKALLYKKSLLHHENRRIMSDINQSYFLDKPFRPLLKWPGGKTDDLKVLRDSFSYLLPKQVRNYYEPFLGGGAVWLSVKAERYFVNDLCEDLISFYECIRDKDVEFFGYIEAMTQNWDLLAKIGEDEVASLYGGQVTEVLSKYKRQIYGSFFSPIRKDDYWATLLKCTESKIKKIHALELKHGKLSEADLVLNIQGALKAGLYTSVRDIFNNSDVVGPLRVACFYFLRDYCYSSMFRYNAAGEFNVPYGGISYNGRAPNSKVGYWSDESLSSHLGNTTFSRDDFEKFFQNNIPSEDDFVFYDPPYDSTFSTYAENTFGIDDQRRLAKIMIHGNKAKFIAVMKNTEIIRDIYSKESKNAVGVQMLTFDKNYSVSFKDRNDKDVEHLIVARV